MEIINHAEFNNQQFEVLPMTSDEPLVIEREGTAIAVLISPERFERLQDVEDFVSASMAERGLSVSMLFDLAGR